MKITGGRVRISDLADEAGIITDLEATGVHFTGPAVVLLGDGLRFDRNGINTPDGPDAVYWELDPARAVVVGAIGIFASSIVDCTFTGVGFTMPAAVAEQFFGTLRIES